MLIYAHRGSSGTHPENTIAAFQEAAKLPINGVEFDVHVSKDGELVVIHDYTVDRTSNGTGAVRDLTLAELKTYDFGSWFSPNFQNERIPTLAEVFHIFAQTNQLLNIELKSNLFAHEAYVQLVIDTIEAHQMTDRVIISSFDHSAIRHVKNLFPSIETAALVPNVLVDPPKYLKMIPADSYHTSFAAALRQSIHEPLQRAGIPIRVYTINRIEQAKQLQAINIHTIFTDYPQKMLNALQ